MTRWPLITLLLLATLWTVATIAPAAAGQPASPPVDFESDATVTTDPGGVTIDIQTTQTRPGDTTPGADIESQSGGGSAASQPPCPIVRTNPAPGGVGPAPPGHTYGLWRCTDNPLDFGFALLPTQEDQPVPPTVTVDPEQLARSLRDRLPVPRVRIAANPARALAGLETSFWLTTLEGTPYQGAPLERTASSGGVTVQVQATPTRYTWRFGDTAPDSTLTTTSTGRPVRSPIRHTYQHHSAGYQLQCDFVYTVRWRQPGVSGWAALPPITRTVTTALPVAQSQAAVTAS